MFLFGGYSCNAINTYYVTTVTPGYPCKDFCVPMDTLRETVFYWMTKFLSLLTFAILRKNLRQPPQPTALLLPLSFAKLVIIFVKITMRWMPSTLPRFYIPCLTALLLSNIFDNIKYLLLWWCWWWCVIDLSLHLVAFSIIAWMNATINLPGSHEKFIIAFNVCRLIKSC